MSRLFVATVACVIAVATGAEGAPRSRKPTAPPAQRVLPAQSESQQDEFRSCDVAVRDFVQGRKQATALPVKEVKVDGLRMTLNFVHPFGESGDTPSNLGFLRGESIEERRKALHETKQKMRALAEAAKTGNVWYVIALTNDNADISDARRSPATGQPSEGRSSASAVILASLENKCVTVSEFRTIPFDSLSDELRVALGERGRQPPPAANSAVGPQQSATEPNELGPSRSGAPF
jgi:hypothetical protein